MIRTVEVALWITLYALLAWTAWSFPARSDVIVYSGGDRLTLGPSTQQGPFAEVYYSNYVGGDSNVPRTYAAEWNGIAVEIRIQLNVRHGNKERIFVAPQDPNLIAWPEEAFLMDGEFVRIQIIGPMF